MRLLLSTLCLSWALTSCSDGSTLGPVDAGFIKDALTVDLVEPDLAPADIPAEVSTHEVVEDTGGVVCEEGDGCFE